MDDQHAEGVVGWVYVRSESSLWTVGFYSPDSAWHPESDYGSKAAAAERVHWLNGGAQTPNKGEPTA